EGGAARVDVLSAAGLDAAGWALLDAADAIAFGAPTYMGGASSRFRAFAEGTSAAMRDDLRWRDKVAAGFTTSGCMSGDKLGTLQGLALLAAQHGMVWVGVAQLGGWNHSAASPEDPNRLGSWLGAMAQADVDRGPDLAPPETDLRTAHHLGHRVATVAAWIAAAREARPSAGASG
ncbi:flavodoxin family protein, partial [Patulibacter sp. S7RM1-6]